MIAYYNITAFITLNILDIIHNCDGDYVLFNVTDSSSGQKTRKIKSLIRATTRGTLYFMHNHSRIYLDECMRVK